MRAAPHHAHWITPAHMPKRYDTQFFLAEAPAAHVAVHDGHESVDSIWITPQDALTGTDEGRYKLVFATQMNLNKLARHATAADAMAAACAEPVVTVLARPAAGRSAGRHQAPGAGRRRDPELTGATVDPGTSLFRTHGRGWPDHDDGT